MATAGGPPGYSRPGSEGLRRELQRRLGPTQSASPPEADFLLASAKATRRGWLSPTGWVLGRGVEEAGRVGASGRERAVVEPGVVAELRWRAADLQVTAQVTKSATIRDLASAFRRRELGGQNYMAVHVRPYPDKCRWPAKTQCADGSTDLAGGPRLSDPARSGVSNLS